MDTEDENSSNKLLDILMSILIVIIMAIFGVFISGALYFYLHSTTVADPARYLDAIELIENKDKISHFPKFIHPDAKEVQLYAFSELYQGEIMLLKFKMDKKYILKELKAHKYINKGKSIGTKQKFYNMPTYNDRIIYDNYIFYVIRNERNINDHENYFPHFSGIGVDKDMNYILYYYNLPKGA